MKRLLIVSNDFPPAVGGIARVLLSICASLPPERFRVLAQRCAGDAEFDARQPYRVWREAYGAGGVIRRALSQVLFPLRALRLARAEGCDTLYFDKPYRLGAVGLLGRVFGLRYMVNAYGNDILVPRNWIEDALRKRVLRGAERVIACSRFTRDELVRLGVAESRIVIMLPKADFSAYASDSGVERFKVEHGLAGRRVILSVGRLVERKGFDQVIAALPRVRAALPDVLYLLVGGGPDRPRLEDLARAHSVADAVRFVEGCDDEEKIAYYHACDVFAMPSRHIRERGDVEAFGIVYLEANACGKPVVGGRSGGISDAVLDGETGLLCDPLDPADVARALIALLSDPERARRMGEAGRARVFRDFGIEGYAGEFEEKVFAGWDGP